MKIREYTVNDVIGIEIIYRKAFSGFPWYEDLSIKEVKRRWNIQRLKSGFKCLVAEIDGQVVGATWWNSMTIEELNNERGGILGVFPKKFVGCKLIWLRETCVSPEFQNLGVGTLLKQDIFIHLSDIGKSTLLLTRMREDNFPIISINKKLGFQQTGIKVPSSQIVGIFHEYWFKYLLKRRVQ